MANKDRSFHESLKKAGGKGVAVFRAAAEAVSLQAPECPSNSKPLKASGSLARRAATSSLISNKAMRVSRIMGHL